MRAALTLFFLWAGCAVPLSAGSLSLRIVQGMPMVTVEAGAGGQTGLFLLDTGAEETVFDPAFARRAGLPVRGSERVNLPSGSTRAGRTAPVDLRAGTRRWRSPGVLTLDLSPVARHLGCEVAGLLGLDFFQGQPLRLDFQNRQVLTGSSARSLPRGGIVLPLETRNGALCTQVRVGSRSLRRVRVDTGCDRTLCWVRGGHSSSRRFTTRVGLGSWQSGEVETQCFRREIFSGEQGLLGMGLLGKFRSVMLDPGAGRLVLHPR